MSFSTTGSVDSSSALTRDGGERRAQVVADLPGELGQVLVRATKVLLGTRQLVEGLLEGLAAEAQLEHVHDLRRHHVEGSLLDGAELARDEVEHAETTERHAVGRDDRGGRVEPHRADLAVHERIVLESLVDAGVGDHDGVGVVHHGRAHRVLARADQRLESGRDDRVLRGAADHVDDRVRHLADLGDQVDEGLQVAAGRPVEDAVALELVVDGGRGNG